MSVGVVIPTYQGEKVLPRCLLPLLASSIKPKILVIDSSSTDHTVRIAKSFGVDVLVQPKEEFNHGFTREKGRKLLQTEIVVMMTQDAYLKESEMLEMLISPLIRQEASISYARQLPHKEADIFAKFSRDFNYSKKSHYRSIDDIEKYGIYTFFCSNSCAAYRNKALDDIGGFPSVIFGEDTIVAAKLLRCGHNIAYVAESEVYHSHNHTLVEEFCRHVKMGQGRKMFAELFATAGSTDKRGRLYAKTLMTHLLKNQPLKVPYGILHLLAKWVGFHIGEFF